MSNKATCPICQKTFEPRFRAKYCSDYCRGIGKANKQKEWRDAHPEYYRKWKEKNPSYHKEYLRAYRKAEKERDAAAIRMIKKESRND